MTKKATKRSGRDRQAAVRQRNRRAEFNAPESGGETDPPIIVTGGSVIIASPVELTPAGTEQRQHNGQTVTYYIYRNDTVTISEIVARGRGNPHRDQTNNGQFEVKLERRRQGGKG